MTLQSVPPVPAGGTIAIATVDVERASASGRTMATRDPAVIRAWALRYSAEPATGEASLSGPATLDVEDGGTGLRFNFPGSGRFRPIGWDEWLGHLEQRRLVFVYEEGICDRAYALWQARGAGHGGDLRDWFDAERQLAARPSGSVGRYWILPRRADTND